MQREMKKKQKLQYSYQKTKTIKKDKEGHYVMIKISIQEEDYILINIYACNIGAPKYIKQILTDIN